MNNKTLLLVDDEKSILRSYARDLRAEHYNVTTASDGEEAIRVLWKNNFNMIITDLVMPGPSGIEVVRQAKKRSPAICAMVLTGYGDMTSAVEALRLGADDYLLKPIDTEELLLRMTELLHRQEERQKITLPRKVLTVCAYCRDVKDEGGEKENVQWGDWESFLTRRAGIIFSHGCCPGCFERLKVEWNL